MAPADAVEAYAALLRFTQAVYGDQLDKGDQVRVQGGLRPCSRGVQCAVAAAAAAAAACSGARASTQLLLPQLQSQHPPVAPAAPLAEQPAPAPASASAGP